MVTNRAPKVLVVDDEADLESLVLQRMRRAIRAGRYQFAFARNGLEALELLRTDRDIEVIVTDINMPEMDGLTLLQEVPKVDPEVRSVVVTAYSDMHNMRTAMSRGAFDFISKPVDFQDLEGAIDRALLHRAAVEKLAAGDAGQQPDAASSPTLIHMQPGAETPADATSDSPPTPSHIHLTASDAPNSGVKIVSAEGRIDAATIVRFRRVMNAVADASERMLILDLAEATYLGSEGLGALLNIAKVMQRNNAVLAICSPAEHVRMALRISGFDQIIPVYPSLTEALAACRP